MIPGILVTVELYLRPNGLMLPNWQAITRWNEESIRSHAWTRLGQVIRTEEEVGLEDLRREIMGGDVLRLVASGRRASPGEVSMVVETHMDNGIDSRVGEGAECMEGRSGLTKRVEEWRKSIAFDRNTNELQVLPRRKPIRRERVQLAVMKCAPQQPYTPWPSTDSDSRKEDEGWDNPQDNAAGTMVITAPSGPVMTATSGLLAPANRLDTEVEDNREQPVGAAKGAEVSAKVSASPASARTQMVQPMTTLPQPLSACATCTSFGVRCVPITGKNCASCQQRRERCDDSNCRTGKRDRLPFLLQAPSEPIGGVPQVGDNPPSKCGGHVLNNPVPAMPQSAKEG